MCTSATGRGGPPRTASARRHPSARGPRDRSDRNAAPEGQWHRGQAPRRRRPRLPSSARVRHRRPSGRTAGALLDASPPARGAPWPAVSTAPRRARHTPAQPRTAACRRRSMAGGSPARRSPHSTAGRWTPPTDSAATPRTVVAGTDAGPHERVLPTSGWRPLARPSELHAHRLAPGFAGSPRRRTTPSGTFTPRPSPRRDEGEQTPHPGRVRDASTRPRGSLRSSTRRGNDARVDAGRHGLTERCPARADRKGDRWATRLGRQSDPRRVAATASLTVLRRRAGGGRQASPRPAARAVAAPADRGRWKRGARTARRRRQRVAAVPIHTLGGGGGGRVRRRISLTDVPIRRLPGRSRAP
ncbi:hypothetical protein TSOC111612_22030 [Tsukamurella ocularis]